MSVTKKKISVQPVDNRLSFLIASAKRTGKQKFVCLTISEADALLDIVRKQLTKAPDSIRISTQ